MSWACSPGTSSSRLWLQWLPCSTPLTPHLSSRSAPCSHACVHTYIAHTYRVHASSCAHLWSCCLLHVCSCSCSRGIPTFHSLHSRCPSGLSCCVRAVQLQRQRAQVRSTPLCVALQRMLAAGAEWRSVVARCSLTALVPVAKDAQRTRTPSVHLNCSPRSKQGPPCFCLAGSFFLKPWAHPSACA